MTSTPMTWSKARLSSLIDFTSTVSAVTRQTMSMSCRLSCTSFRAAARAKAPGR